MTLFSGRSFVVRFYSFTTMHRNTSLHYTSFFFPPTLWSDLGLSFSFVWLPQPHVCKRQLLHLLVLLGIALLYSQVWFSTSTFINRKNYDWFLLFPFLFSRYGIVAFVSLLLPFLLFFHSIVHLSYILWFILLAFLLTLLFFCVCLLAFVCPSQTLKNQNIYQNKTKHTSTHYPSNKHTRPRIAFFSFSAENC